MRTTFFVFIALVFIFSSGCTIIDGNAIVTGDTKAAISSEQVRLYRSAPESYKEIAFVSASAGHDFKKGSSLLKSAIERLKQEAAKIGANGVIVTEINERDEPNVTTSYGSAIAMSNSGSAYANGNVLSISRGDAYTRVKGIAVYVPQ